MAVLSQIPGLDVAGGLVRLRGDPVRYLKYLRLFASTHSGDVTAIGAACAAGDLGQLERLAHTLKGSAGTLGATDVTEAATRLVAALRAGVGDAEATALAAVLTTAIKELVAAVGSPANPNETAQGADPR